MDTIQQKASLRAVLIKSGIVCLCMGLFMAGLLMAVNIEFYLSDKQQQQLAAKVFSRAKQSKHNSVTTSARYLRSNLHDTLVVTATTQQRLSFWELFVEAFSQSHAWLMLGLILSLCLFLTGPFFVLHGIWQARP